MSERDESSLADCKWTVKNDESLISSLREVRGRIAYFHTPSSAVGGLEDRQRNLCAILDHAIRALLIAGTELGAFHYRSSFGEKVLVFDLACHRVETPVGIR